jgi:ABC-type sulfate transport system permease subunit
MKGSKARRALPGFGLSLGFTLFYISLIVLIPLAAVFFKTFELSWAELWSTITNPRVLASYRISFTTALWAGLINEVSVPGQKVHRQSRRYSFRSADGGSGHRAHNDLRENGLGRFAA